MTYAAKTSVSVEKTRAQLDVLLGKHGAPQRRIGTDDVKGHAICEFVLGGHMVKMVVPLPLVSDFIRVHRRGYQHTTSVPEREKLHAQAVRERWRAILLLTKAKLEAISLGVATVEGEFLADVVLPNGNRVHDEIRGTLAQAFETKGSPKILLLGPARP